MEKHLLKTLFNKHVMLGSTNDNSLEAVYSLAKIFGIKVTSGFELANIENVKLCEELIGRNVTGEFYKGFPESVRQLSYEEIGIDQFIHYFFSYGLGTDLSKQSVFESEVYRFALPENDKEIKEFRIVDENEAVKILCDVCDNILKSSRPLTEENIQLIVTMMILYNYEVKASASKNTLMKLLYRTKNMNLLKYLSVSDILKMVEVAVPSTMKTSWGKWEVPSNLNKLNLSNQNRKFITNCLDAKLDKVSFNSIAECSEQRANWCGLLHHIHYAPKSDKGRDFVYAMRGDVNKSYMAKIVKYIENHEIKKAVDEMNAHKGAGFILRNINWLLNNSTDYSDIEYIMSNLNSKNKILFLQLMYQYSSYEKGNRTFSFIKNNLMKVWQENNRSKSSILSDEMIKTVSELCRTKFNKLASATKIQGKVFIDPEMKNIALPLNESTGSSGLGVLPKGSRIQLPEGKCIRVFTHWKYVNDIDLSLMGINKDGTEVEFSWRTFGRGGMSNAELTFSGDQTRGYEGGAEYFDVNLDAIKKSRPNLRYLVACDNVFTCGESFNNIYCIAGAMLREKPNSGEIFEPSTVKTAFKVEATSNFIYMFALDIETGELIWLNTSNGGYSQIAATSTGCGFLQKYFNLTSVMNVYDLFELKANELTDNIDEADIIVSDSVDQIPGKEVIHSYDFDKLIAVINE